MTRCLFSGISVQYRYLFREPSLAGWACIIMLPWTRKSKRLAEEVADTFNGRLENCRMALGLRTCRYCVKIEIRDMRVHAYFFHPYYELWLQNFIGPDVFSLCLPAPLPHLAHSIPLEDPFKDYDANVFVSLICHANAARSFLQAANNEIDIKKLLITKNERLIITNSNLSLFAEYPGISTHRMGSTELGLGRVASVKPRDQLLVPDQDTP